MFFPLSNKHKMIGFGLMTLLGTPSFATNLEDPDFIQSTCAALSAQISQDDFQDLLTQGMNIRGNRLFDDVRSQLPTDPRELSTFKSAILRTELSGYEQMFKSLALCFGNPNTTEMENAKASLFKFRADKPMLRTIQALDATKFADDFNFRHLSGLGALQILFEHPAGYYNIYKALKGASEDQQSWTIKLQSKFLDKFLLYTGNMPLEDMFAKEAQKVLFDLETLAQTKQFTREQILVRGELLMQEFTQTIRVRLFALFDQRSIETVKNGTFPRFGSPDRTLLDQCTLENGGNFTKGYTQFLKRKFEDYFNIFLFGKNRLLGRDRTHAQFIDDVETIKGDFELYIAFLSTLQNFSTQEEKDLFEMELKEQRSYKDAVDALNDANHWLWGEFGPMKSLLQ